MGELTQPILRERLENWKEIAQYLRRSVRTVQRWEDEAGLPVHRLNHDQRSSVYAYTDELELWRINREPLLKGPEEEVTTPARHAGTKKLAVALAIALVIVTLAGAAAVVWNARKDGVVALQTKPLSSLPGGEQSPALSPDGLSVVFTYTYQGSVFLYRMRVTGGDPVRLTQAVEKRPEFDAAWSPDGKWIGFLRRITSGEATVVVIPAAGGPEREFGTVHGISMGSNMRVPNRGVGWMADSRALIVSSGEVTGAPNRLWRVDLATGGRTPLTTPPPGALGDAGPSISPDRRRIAFHRALAAGIAEIFTGNLAADGSLSDEPVQLTKEGTFTAGPLWISNQELIYYGYRNGMMRLSRRRVAAGSKEEIIAATEGIDPSYSVAGARLVYTSLRNNGDLYRTDLPLGADGSPVPYLSSTRQEAGPAISPDGGQVAFTSGRSGWPEVWVCRSDQSGCHQVSRMNGSMTGFSSWSPDGRWIAFSSNGPSKGGIYIVRPDGSGLREVAAHPAEDIAPCWSADGASIYFTSNRSGRYQIWRVAAASGEVEAITDHGHRPIASRDGRWLFYAREYAERSRLLRLDLRTRQEFDDLGELWLFSSAAGQKGIYFKGDRRIIRYWQPGFTSPHEKFKLPLSGGLGFAVAPDESYLIYEGSKPIDRDLVLIEGIR